MLAFGQCVCGFDLLRSGGRSFVCDVNGWSFVKSSKKVYEDAASLLRQISMRRLCPKRLHNPRTLEPVRTPEDKSVDGSAAPELEMESEEGDVKEDGEEMVALIAMIRHGDRTPKQKLKFKIRNASLLDVFERLGLRASAQLKLKKPKNLEHLLDVVTAMLGDAEAAKDTDGDFDKRKDGLTLDRLRQIEFVMRMHPFSGINRKVQVKATKWDGEGLDDERVVEALFILKWGGELTASGKEQSQNLGRMFRTQMYPGDQGGLLRLHSTFRHDLKIYASDEGRVQVRSYTNCEHSLSTVSTHAVPTACARAKPTVACSSPLPHLRKGCWTWRAISRPSSCRSSTWRRASTSSSTTPTSRARTLRS